MNIALITTEFYPTHGGIAQHLNSLCKQFKKTNHNLYIFNCSYKNKNIFNILDSLEYSKNDLLKFLKHRTSINTLLNSIKTIISIGKVSILLKLKMILYLFSNPELLIKTANNISKLIPYFKNLKIDLILGGSTFPPVLILIVLLSQMFRKKLIALTHGNDYLTRKPLYLKTPFFRCLDKLIITSERNRINVKKIHNLPDDKLKIIHLGLILKDYEIQETKEVLRNKWKIPQRSFVILSVGRHEPRKKFDLVIRAISEIKKKLPDTDIKYYLIGGGDTSIQLQELAKKMKIEKHIEFMGECSEQIRNEFYRLSDIFIMPSITIKKTRSIEGFGIVYLEANYYKLPVIGTYSGGILEAIKNGYNGLLIEPNNLTELIEKIIYLYENEETRLKMGEFGYKRVVSYFNWDKIIEEYKIVFKEVLNQVSSD